MPLTRLWWNSAYCCSWLVHQVASARIQ